MRRVPIPSDRCMMCNNGIESADHLLITCEFAQQVWTAVSLWIKVPLPRYLLSVVELLEFVKNIGLKGIKRKTIYLVVATVSWSLWLARNETIFKNKVYQVFKVNGDIKVLSYLWITSRAATIKLEWPIWREFSLGA
ncbi:putative reverse transcriptase zinc-binding domain-containing protein [Helianthus annuus]|nr:putative reverse transcriptase zinc-binding domain-containing protein [Helianthus annuus]